MEFSASFPVDLAAFAEGFSAGDGPRPSIRAPDGPFAGLMVTADGAATVAADGETLPLTGDALPAAAVVLLPLPQAGAHPAPVPVLTTAAGGPLPQTPRPTAPPPATALSPLTAAIARAFDGSAAATAQPDATPVAAGAEAGIEQPAIELPRPAGRPPAEPPPTARVVPPPLTADQPVTVPPLPVPAPGQPLSPRRLSAPVEPAVSGGKVSVDVELALPGTATAADGDATPTKPATAAARPEVLASSGTVATDPASGAEPADPPVVPGVAGSSRSDSVPAPSAAAITEGRAGVPEFDLEPGADADQLVTRIRWLADRQIGEARIRLNPPELGALDIRLSVVDDETFVHITTQGAGTRELLEGAIPRLRALLGSGGLSLGGASIDGGQGGAAGNGFRFDESPAGSPVESLTAPAAGQAVRQAAPQAAGRVDLYA